MTPIALFERANNLPIIYTPSHHRTHLQKVCDARQNGQKSTTKHGTITESHNGNNNQHRINNNRTTDLTRTLAKVTRLLKCILLVQNLRCRFCHC